MTELTGNDLAQIEIVKQSVAMKFALTHEGKLEYYLGGDCIQIHLR